MSLPLLVSGADCGPVNPLQGLSKNFDRDRGIQQDYIGGSRAGSSKEAFRTQLNPTPGASQDAAKFFASQHTPLSGPSPYDLSSLHASLLQSSSQAPKLQNIPPQAAAPWAADFLQQQPLRPSPLQSNTSQIDVSHHQQNVSQFQRQNFVHSSGTPQFNTPAIPYHASALVSPGSSGLLVPMLPAQSQQPSLEAHHIAWDREFESQEASFSSSEVVNSQLLQPQDQAQTTMNSGEADEIARTAGLLIHTVRNEQNPKFQNSQFMNLMRQLRDKEAVVAGKDIVQNQPDHSTTASTSDWTYDFSASKGKGRAMELSSSNAAPQPYSLRRSASSSELASVLNMRVGGPLPPMAQSTTAQRPTVEQVQEDPNDAYFRQENEDYIKYWEASTRPVIAEVAGVRTSQNAQFAEWDILQRDWDAFEATATGLRASTRYHFEEKNPYLSTEGSRTRHHLVHTSSAWNPLSESVLELEAAVLRDPQNALRWFELGVKQQENEREQQAFRALQHALELDPNHLPSWLALSISHTNEGNRRGAYDAVHQWIDRNDRYRSAIEQYRAMNPPLDDGMHSERFNDLINCLISIVRGSSEIDADVQIALGVLLNTNEDWDKAQDCFKTALAVRPDDWLLYNRVGATLANGGHAEAALEYYYRALELNPAYIRARYNLGISCINLKRHEEGAQHFLDGLVLQDSETTREPDDAVDKRGVTSSTLWDSLKNCCLQMHRQDLAALCDARDLDAFRLNFHM